MELINEAFRGIIQVTQNGEPVFHHVNGYADLANERPNSLETRFASASAGKTFVAVAVMKLIENQQLSLTTKLGQILNDIDLNQIDPTITIEHLLNHTSGIPDYFDETLMDDYEELWIDTPNYRIRENRDLIPLFINKKMMYEKGTKFQYNNTGYVVLGLIIETISKMPFDHFIKKSVFDPSNMNECGYFELDRLPKNCAHNYISLEDSERYKTNIFSVDAKGTGAGGAFITVNDIAKFWKSLYTGKVISLELVQEMTSRQSGDDTNAYGFGFWLVPIQHTLIPVFQGSDPGVSFLSEYHHEKGLLTTLVSNFGDNVWQEMRMIRKTYY